MRRWCVLAGCVVAGLLAASRPSSADEPFWNSRPLGYWLNQLQVGTEAERVQAARGVGEMAATNGAGSVAAALPLLVPCLSASDAPLRAAAADAIGPMGPRADAAIDRLLNLFEHDPVADVRRSAGLAAGSVQPGSPALVSVSTRVLGGDHDTAVREVAAAMLVESGSAAAAALPVARSGLTDASPIVRVYAAAIVAHAGDAAAAMPVLLDGLQAVDAAVRVESAGLLGDAGRLDRRTVPALVAALADEAAQVRIAAADALGAIGHSAQAAIDPLWRLIRDPDDGVREHALGALRRIKE